VWYDTSMNDRLLRGGRMSGRKTKGIRPMATETMEPPMTEDVEVSTTEEEGANKPKRGRKSAEDDPRAIYEAPEGMVDGKGLIKAWLDDNGYVFGGG